MIIAGNTCLRILYDFFPITLAFEKILWANVFRCQDLNFARSIQQVGEVFMPPSVIVEKYMDLRVIIYSQAGSSLTSAFLNRTLLKDVVREHVDFIIIL